MELLLVIALSLFALLAIVVWWILDIDIADIVAIIAAPAAGITLVYWYSTPLAWAGGVLLLAIGGFALYYLLKRRAK
jgi:hypothetical protein